MKKLIFAFAILGLTFTACKKDPIEPAPINNPNPNPSDTTDTIGDTTTVIDTTIWNNLKFDFAVNTQLPRETLDSVVIIHYVDEVPTDSITLLRTDVDGMNITGGYMFYSSNMVTKPNSIELNGSGDSFYIFHYLNTPIGGNIYNFFEFGTTNWQTASGTLTYSVVGGKYVLSGYQTY